MRRILLLLVIPVMLMVGFSLAAEPGSPPYAQTGAPLAPVATNQPPAPAAVGPTLEDSLKAANAAIKTCAARDQKVGVTIVDSAGIPKAVLASDGASARGVQSSTNKALTALHFKSATSELAERSGHESELDQALKSNSSYNSRPGGLPLLQGNVLLGAVGVGGAKGSENDEACAKAALTILERAKARRP